VKRAEGAAGAALFVLALAVYLGSPFRALLDPRYAVLTAEVLVTTGGWDLAPFLERDALERAPRAPREARARPGAGERWLETGPHYQMARRDGRVLYLYPPGVPLLAAPLVAVARPAGYSALNESGTYSYRRELELHALLGALVTAAAVLVTLRLARRELPPLHALGVALAAAFGSSLWSVASRALWTHTFAALLIALAWLEILRWDDGEARRPLWLGALLSASFWVRPTAALVAAALTLYVAARHRPALSRLAGAGALGLAAFLATSWATWGSLLPPYYALGAGMSTAGFGTALAGLLVSPTRGLLVFSPVLLLVPAVLARTGVPAARRAPAALAAAVVAAHLLLYASWPMWWGGGSYGPRLLTELVPLLAWLGALAVRAVREPGGRRGIVPAARRALAAAAIALSLAGAVAHGGGAVSSRLFHALSRTSGPDGPRLWDWRFNPYSAVARALAEPDGRPHRRRPARRAPGERPPATPPPPSGAPPV
jgi:hypothetical protein